MIRQEEERFAETLAQGMALLDTAIGGLGGKTQIPGEAVFKLYDTFGFPVDLTNDIARERGLSIDEPGFEAAMDAQRARARAASKFSVDLRGDMSVDTQTSFVGYDGEHGVGRVVTLFRGKESVTELRVGEAGQVVLDVTPFYAESGGQVGDRGVLSTPHCAFRSQRHAEARQGARCTSARLLEGTTAVGDAVEAIVDGATPPGHAR